MKALLSIDDACIRLKHLAGTPPLATLATALGHDADLHLVGGTVRDVILGAPCSDIDLATVLHPDEVVTRLKKAHLRAIPTGIEHGTITALVADESIEITTFRTPGSRTTFIPSSSINQDLGGRDFTINALAFSLAKQAIVDPWHGYTDLSHNLIRAVVDPCERLREDPLRILRLVRLGPANGLQMEETTRLAARNLRDELVGVSTERIRDEIVKIILSKFPRAGFNALIDLGILEVLLPEILPTIGCEQNEFHVDDVYEHTMSVLERCPANHRLLRLAALFHDLGKPHTLSIGSDGRRHFYLHERVSTDICRTVMERLRFSHRETEDVALLVATHMRPISCGAAGARRLMRELGELFSEWRLFKWADQPPALDSSLFDAEAAAFDELVTHEKLRLEKTAGGKLAINGHDLIKLGISPGPAMGKILAILEDEVLESPERNERNQLLSRVREITGNNT